MAKRTTKTAGTYQVTVFAAVWAFCPWAGEQTYRGDKPVGTIRFQAPSKTDAFRQALDLVAEFIPNHHIVNRGRMHMVEADGSLTIVPEPMQYRPCRRF